MCRVQREIIFLSIILEGKLLRTTQSLDFASTDKDQIVLAFLYPRCSGAASLHRARISRPHYNWRANCRRTT
ncbi:hypothetical protein PITCH_A350014 [uncultured Desulfobacterium sp.]|uniref:Uncharacterized protein n=1 Tax=uncultured Desulfobacterium sp. TaxID=201089 RepID=A0A445MZB6_9BACT|nr:hypothetical protein PITCH_A350014 [uncultured Desulfobacterium sp.]